MKKLASLMRTFILSAFTLLLFSSCASHEEESPVRSTLQGMLGSWNFEGTDLTETWSQLETDHYQGVVNRSFNGVLEPIQHIDIVLSGDSATYTGTRIGAHETSIPIRYRLTESENGTMVFENMLGRFPQMIRYDVHFENRFSVTMYGEQDGRSREKRFVYSRTLE